MTFLLSNERKNTIFELSHVHFIIFLHLNSDLGGRSLFIMLLRRSLLWPQSENIA